MPVDLVSPFAASLLNVFETMLNLPLVVEAAREDGAAGAFEIAATVDFDGEIRGRATMLLSSETGRRLAAIFAGVELAPGDPDFDDAIGELAHMVCGGAKGLFGFEEARVSCPRVASQAGRMAVRRAAPGAVTLAARGDCGDIVMEIALRRAGDGGLEAAAQAVVGRGERR